MTADHGVAVQLEACAKTYPNGVRALDPITLDVARGETVVFLGPSGCGKTTMLRIIAGLEQPDAGGRVLFNGADVTGIPIEQRNIGMVFQSYALFPNMNVSDNIGYGLKIRGVDAARRRARVAELIALTGIEGLEHRRIDQLSGGQRQRVALARAVAVHPSVLLLDEPLTALDAALRERLRGELDRLLRTLGITTIYVTHDQAEAMALGDRIVVMRKGAIAQIGKPREIYFAPASRFVAEFIGAANIFEADYAAGVLTLAGAKLPLANGAANGAAVAMIRPESIKVVSPDGAMLAGCVDNVSFVGDRQRLTISGVGGKPILVDAPQRRCARRGAALPRPGATGLRRPCASGHADDVCRHSGHDLSGAEPRRCTRSRRVPAAVVQHRARGVSPACLVSGRALRQRRHSLRADRRIRWSISVL
jgi:putative spermidine/putrescine transport system ATP-binding protein